MTTSAVRFSEHAIDRMLEWGLDVDDVEAALAEGETIEDYADGSRLLLGRAGCGLSMSSSPTKCRVGSVLW